MGLLILKKYLINLLNLVFPPRCLICRSPGLELVCNNCHQQIKFINHKEELKSIGTIYSITSYEGPIKKGIHAFKFKKKKQLAPWLGGIFIQKLPKSYFQDFDFVSYIPISDKRLKERGFNQAKLLAEIVAIHLNLSCQESIKRNKETKPQFELKREARIKNMSGAFKISPKTELKGKKIIIVDDIYTTGTTLKECGKVLKASGASQIIGLTLARAKEEKKYANYRSGPRH